jgi:hypothetical protein
MALSIPGLFGAALALVVGLVNYRVIISVVERKLRQLDRSATAEESETFEGKLRFLKRFVLATDIVLFPFFGYWIGRTIGG